MALGYGEGIAALVMLHGLAGDEWQTDARDILDHVDAGCRVLLARAHKKGSDAGPVTPATQ